MNLLTLNVHCFFLNVFLCLSMLVCVMSYPWNSTSVRLLRKSGIQFMSPQEESRKLILSLLRTRLRWSVTECRVLTTLLVAALVLPGPLSDSWLPRNHHLSA